MEFGAGGRAVFVGGEDDEVLAGGEEGGGKDPLGEVQGIVGEVPSSQVDGGRSGIVDLDPVGGLSVLIEKPC